MKVALHFLHSKCFNRKMILNFYVSSQHQKNKIDELGINVPISWRLEWPMLWRITKNSLLNEGTYKWVNWAPIFFWYKLLPNTYGPQKFQKSEFLKLIISLLHYFWHQNWAQWHKMSGENTHLYFFYFWFKNKRFWGEKSGKKPEKIPKT